MKYIIEIEDEPLWRQSALHNILKKKKNFNALVFDKEGLDKLTPLDTEPEEAYQKGLSRGYKDGYEDGRNDTNALEYQRGLDDAWECAKYLFSEMSDTEINLVFPQEWNNGGFKALMALHPQDAIDRIKAYEEQQKVDEIKVGDEVMNTLGTMDNAVGYFFGDSSDGCYKVLRYVDGKFKTGIWNKENCERTGKHSYAVERMVAVMREGAE